MGADDRTNLTGAFFSVKAFLPALRASRGQVILIGSASGSWPDVSGPAYQASKGECWPSDGAWASRSRSTACA